MNRHDFIKQLELWHQATHAVREARMEHINTEAMEAAEDAAGRLWNELTSMVEWSTDLS